MKKWHNSTSDERNSTANGTTPYTPENLLVKIFLL
jgi:hypothetical protein